jgi:hypothetical protein
MLMTRLDLMPCLGWDAVTASRQGPLNVTYPAPPEEVT